MREAPSADPDVFAAIASPVRRALLDALAVEPKAVRDLAAGFPISRPAISQHLRILKRAELVREERTGREHRYRLNPAPLYDAHVWIGRYEQFWRDHLSSLRDLLDTQ